MVGAEKYFVKGLYDSHVDAALEQAGSSLRIGIKCTSAPAYYWTMFDHFRLYFFGGFNPDGMAPIQPSEQEMASKPVYDLLGRKVSGTPSPGIYIVGGRKIVLK